MVRHEGIVFIELADLPLLLEHVTEAMRGTDTTSRLSLSISNENFTRLPADAATAVSSIIFIYYIKERI